MTARAALLAAIEEEIVAVDRAIKASTFFDLEKWRSVDTLTTMAARAQLDELLCAQLTMMEADDDAN